MKTAIFIKSFWPDRDWLDYCLRSIQHFGSGYSETVVAAEDERFRRRVEGRGARFVKVPQHPGNGYLYQQVIKMRADSYVRRGTTHIVFTDSDCFFTDSHSPKTWVINGKPRLIITSHSKVNTPWQAPTQQAIGGVIEFETMRCHPSIFDVRTLQFARDVMTEHVRRPWDEWIMRSGSFSEFNVIGNVALRYRRHLYHVVDTTDKGHNLPTAKQHYTHCPGRGLTPEIRQFMEAKLSKR